MKEREFPSVSGRGTSRWNAKLEHLISWRAVKGRMLRSLDQRVPSERLALSFAVGVFCGILPFPGHTVVATVLAVVFRLNLLAAVAGAWLNFPLIIPFTYAFAFFVGSHVTGTEIPHVAWSEMVNVRLWWSTFRAYFIPMSVGTTIVGSVWAFGAYFVALRLARRFRRKRDGEDAARADAPPVEEVYESR